ncbi:MAG: 30S ribosomal protein S3 [Candidatus Nanoarchaeia archaeon]|nr:30S ribosomal protein S3 [Candidatus Nanoarchaeia archaeon]
MIERKFVSQKFKEFHIKQYLKLELNRAGLSDVKLQRTSMGEKILISANRPGLVVGRGGAVIQKLTKVMKDQFKLENPEIEIEEIKDVNTDANIIAEYIVNQLERFGSQRFKGIAHKALSRVMEGGALGVEILISGKIPSSRAKSWRFAVGYMKKCGDIAITGVNTCKTSACLKTGIVGVQVKIMPGSTILPDKIEVSSTAIEQKPIVESKNRLNEVKDEKSKKRSTKKEPRKTSTKKKTENDSKPKKEKAVKKEALPSEDKQ